MVGGLGGWWQSHSNPEMEKKREEKGKKKQVGSLTFLFEKHSLSPWHVDKASAKCQGWKKCSYD